MEQPANWQRYQFFQHWVCRSNNCCMPEIVTSRIFDVVNSSAYWSSYSTGGCCLNLSASTCWWWMRNFTWAQINNVSLNKTCLQNSWQGHQHDNLHLHLAHTRSRQRFDEKQPSLVRSWLVLRPSSQSRWGELGKPVLKPWWTLQENRKQRLFRLCEWFDFWSIWSQSEWRMI